MMAPPPRLELDPNGDIELILVRPDEQKLQWSSDIQKTQKKKKKLRKKKAASVAQEHTIEEPNSEGLAPEAPSAEHALPEELTVQESCNQETTPEEFGSNAPPVASGATRENELRMLVSSRHLCLASSTFRKMLSGPFLEGSSNNGLIREVRTTEWDASAFLIVQDIIHGHNVSVPNSVSVELLAKIAAIVDYYDCHDISQLFVDRWIQDLQSSFPSSYGKECMLWMSISWVFLRLEILQKMAMLAVMGCQTPVETMGLPVPETLVRKCIAFRLRDGDASPVVDPSRFKRSKVQDLL